MVLDLDLSRPAEPVQLGGEASSSGGGAPSRVVHGLRHRLCGRDVSESRPLPSTGKLMVRFGVSKAEALLQLPEVPLRSLNDGPATLWLTVGLLAVDGLTVQLKLRKADKPSERDKAAGLWYAYHVVGGALTVLRCELLDSELNEID